MPVAVSVFHSRKKFDRTDLIDRLHSTDSVFPAHTDPQRHYLAPLFWLHRLSRNLLYRKPETRNLRKVLFYCSPPGKNYSTPRRQENLLLPFEKEHPSPEDSYPRRNNYLLKCLGLDSRRHGLWENLA